MSHDKLGKTLITLALGVTVITFFMVEPIPQDMGYHNFSDTKAILNIPNALNVLSNIPFLIVGILGVITLLKSSRLQPNIIVSNLAAYYLLFTGSALVGLGSGYYHLWPDNETLAWDRAPMTIAFMALYSVIITEFVSERLGRQSLFPLLCLGLASVAYWRHTESLGAGDLRFYAVVQFFPILTIPIMLLCFTPRFSGLWAYWFLIAMYILAKLCESFDSQIHSLLAGVSGHSIKHLLPAIGLYILLRSYKHRTTL